MQHSAPAVEDVVTLGEQLVALRKAAGLSQSEIADRIGKTTGYVSMLERGERDQPSLKVLTDWARACGRTVDVHFVMPGAPQSALVDQYMERLSRAYTDDVVDLLRFLSVADPDVAESVMETMRKLVRAFEGRQTR